MSTGRPEAPSTRPVLTGLPRGGQVRRLALFGTRGVVGRCRDFARQALLDWGWLPAGDEEQQAMADDVLLLVSELVTNACQHAGGPQQLLLHGTTDALRVEVTDASPEQPRPRLPLQPGRPGGHGLVTVARLSLRWGVTVRSDRSGKSVWLEVAAPPSGD
ncbi:anti-sigma regulatory factor (Ser/Thr protein kinase) [Kitasatospora sp. MAP12-15]|uniref:ATP-binding protein n=1 Tax=unclassified Kitasatospora TaxID=2633591 RepID=UPI0024737522|nr:ATP-binding protein [Kitasatospora sp. MAP12-44]MDH6109446.1 anti-sigma regulatory factor (Ser/Thr protein kinase) [Kitasatospora sp. MAP12-44]